MVPHILTFILIVASVVTTLAADKKFEKRFTVKSGENLLIKTDCGDVAVIGASGDQVVIVAEMRGSAKDVEDFTITATQSERGIEVTGRTRSSRWWPWKFDELELRYRIEVPHEYSVDLNTSGGDISIEHLKGSVSGGTSGGDVNMRNVEGPIAVETSGGDILADRVAGNLKFETSGGDITVTASRGDIELETSGGNIRVSSTDGKIHAQTSGGDITVALQGQNKGVFAETSGGDIGILLAKDMGAAIDASSSGGSVICEMPITIKGRLDDSELKGILNGGGETIHAYTSGGDVVLKSPE